MNALDFSIIACFFAAMIALGFYFKKSRAASDYFLGGKRFGAFSLCLSAMATQLSAISFISAPAFVGLRPGGGMQWLTFEFGVPLAMILLIGILAPALYRSGVVSIYAFLEQRLGRSSRLLLGAVFLLSRSFATGVTIYAVCLALSWILHISFPVAMTALGLVTIIYSLEGGMKAIVYSEVAQMIIKFLGIATIVGLGLHYLGGWTQFLVHVDRSRLQIVDFHNWGFDGREYGFFPMVCGGLFLYCSYYGTDQTQAQRILCAQDEKTVSKMLLYNGLLRFPITLSYCLGGLILGAFARSNSAFANAVPSSRPDLMIPVFITHYLPHGVIGILVVAIIAAGMSTFSSNLNSLSAVTMEDFITPHSRWARSHYVLASKIITLAWGLVTMLQAAAAGHIAATVIEAINKVSSLFYGPILAMFILAILPKRVSASAANCGVVAGVLINLILWLGFRSVFWFWWNATGAVTTLVVAGALNFLLPRRSLPAHPGEHSETLQLGAIATPAILLGVWFVAIVTASVWFPRFF